MLCISPVTYVTFRRVVRMPVIRFVGAGARFSRLAAILVAVLLLTGCNSASSEGSTPPPESETQTKESSSGPSDADIASTRFRQRVEDILGFTYEGFEFKGPPGSQLSAVPPVWTGEKVRGERDPSAVANGAVFLFASVEDDALIMVDLASVPTLRGSGILRTGWVDRQVIEKAGVCKQCTGFHVIQFYEPGFVYTVIGVDPQGKARSLYPFTEALMRHLKNHPLQGDP
jgi:hypothetical protein